MTRSRRTTPQPLLILVALLILATSASASTVTNIQAQFHDGQTFLTWNNLPGTGWIYHVFASQLPIRSTADLDNAIEIAQVGDDSGVDPRMSSLLGQQVTYRIAADQAPLAQNRGLYVNTATEGALTYYAVTTQRIGLPADRTVRSGDNSTPAPILELLQKPRPVWQRTLTRPDGEDYVLWTSSRATSLYPAMGNMSGRAYHIGLVRGAPGGALLLHGHGRGGNFLNSLIGTGMPGEWVISIDDYLPTGDFATFYFGYEENYDLEQPLNAPRSVGGVIEDYTEARVLYLLEWAGREIPYDRDRVYAMGTSMGGSFAFFLAWHHPDLIAGAFAVVPKLCLGYRPDVYPDLRESLDRMWGSPEIDLPTSVGLRVFQWMDGREQARISRKRGSAPIIGFCGLNDIIVGWGEKVAYFDAMEAGRSGGAWYWDERDHYTPHEQTAWYPMMGASQLYRYRRNQSYPAFSGASNNSLYGTGDPTTADPIGSINGSLDWDSRTISDNYLRWEVDLRTRALVTQDGVLGAPESVTVDVTPRRLQAFILAQYVPYRYEVRRLGDNSLVQTGTLTTDEDAVLTLPQVKVYRTGVRLSIAPTTLTGVTPGNSALRQPALALSQNPVRDKASLTIEWPAEGDAHVELFDLQGRLVRTEFQGSARGFTERTFRSQGIAPGVYVLSARQGGSRTTRRVTILH